MAYFDNDHLLINNIMIDLEQNINKISNCNQLLNQINNIDEFRELRNQLNLLFNDIESDSKTIINTLKVIQFNIRKLYDDFSLFQNNYQDIEIKLKTIINDNSLLINKNKELNELLKDKNKTIEDQREYICKSIKKEGNKRLIMNEKLSNNSNKKNEKFNKELKAKAEFNISDNGNMKSNYNEYHNKLRKNYSVNNKKTDNNNLSNYNKNIPFPVRSINSQKYIFNDELDENGNKSINNNGKFETNNNGINSKNKIELVEKIISLIYNNKQLYLSLKQKYGNNVYNKIVNNNVKIDFLERILKDIHELSKIKVKNKDNKNEKLNALINKENTDFQRMSNVITNTAIFNIDANSGTLTNYFLFNLQREKMIDNFQRKEHIRPKTPKF